MQEEARSRGQLRRSVDREGREGRGKVESFDVTFPFSSLSLPQSRLTVRQGKVKLRSDKGWLLAVKGFFYPFTGDDGGLMSLERDDFPASPLAPSLPPTFSLCQRLKSISLSIGSSSRFQTVVRSEGEYLKQYKRGESSLSG